MPQINKRYYEKLDGFSYVLDELRKKIGTQQTGCSDDGCRKPLQWIM